jgi:hypothetical protein
LQLQNSRLDEHDKRYRPNQHAENICHIVAVSCDIAGATAVNAAGTIWFHST